MARATSQGTVLAGTILRALAIVVALGAGPVPLAHAEPVFISSEPYRAHVAVDGVAAGERTPLVLELAPGEYEIALSRDGHEPVSFRLTVDEGVSAVAHRPLTAGYAIVDAPEEHAGTGYVLPLGSYEVGRRASELTLVPLYPYERRLGTIATLVPVSLGVAAGFSLWSFVNPPDRPEIALVPSIAAQVAAGGALAYATVLFVQRHRFLRQWTPPSEPYRPVSAAAAFAEARELLERGDIGGAVTAFTEYVREFPDAVGVPEALYTLGRLAALEGAVDDARAHYERLLAEYPVVEYYDRTLLQLARLAAQTGLPAEAGRYLDRVTFAHPAVTPEAVASLRSLLAR